MGFQKKRQLFWIKGDFEEPIEKDAFSHKSESFQKFKDMSTTELFELLMFMNMLMNKKVSAFQKRYFEVTANELKAFLSILIFSVYNKVPVKTSYWDRRGDTHNVLATEPTHEERYNSVDL